MLTNDVNTKAQVNEKEIQLLKLQIQEIQIKSNNHWVVNMATMGLRI